MGDVPEAWVIVALMMLITAGAWISVAWLARNPERAPDGSLFAATVAAGVFTLISWFAWMVSHVRI